MTIELSDLKEFVVLLALIAFVGAATAIALTDFRTTTASTTSTTNESKTVSVGTPVGLTDGWASWSISAVRNDSSIVMNSAEYGLTSGNLFNVTNATRATETVFYVDYTASAKDDDYNISSRGLLGIGNATNYLGTTGTIVAIAVLIGFVIVAFRFVQK